MILRTKLLIYSLFNSCPYLAVIFILTCFLQGELSHVDQVEDRNHLPAYTNMLEALSVKIDRISCEVIKNCVNN
jgi:hypothetical protein